MKLLNGFLVVLLCCILVSCNNNERKKAIPPPSGKPVVPLPKRGQPKTFLSCQKKTLSQDECFFNLPALPHDQVYIGLYKDDLNLETTGVVVGKGTWTCHNGVWKTTHEKVCVTCLPGHSLEHCLQELNKL